MRARSGLLSKRYWLDSVPLISSSRERAPRWRRRSCTGGGEERGPKLRKRPCAKMRNARPPIEAPGAIRHNHFANSRLYAEPSSSPLCTPVRGCAWPTGRQELGNSGGELPRLDAVRRAGRITPDDPSVIAPAHVADDHAN